MALAYARGRTPATGMERIIAATAAPLRPWPVLSRPLWAWPPLASPAWARAPGSLPVSWTWQAEEQLQLLQPIRLASISAPPSKPRAKLPVWLMAVSGMAVDAALPAAWPKLPRPDYRIPAGPTRYEHLIYANPPRQFVRWADRIETVLPDAEVDRRCRSLGLKPSAGKIIRGCTHLAAGRCFITRVDDPGVARHELAHCNGWRHPE
jgi:hypothetical protein